MMPNIQYISPNSNPNSSIHLRSATLIDLPSILILENEMWAEGQRCSEENFRKRLRSFASGFLLAENNEGKLVRTFYCVKRKFSIGKGRYSWVSESGDGTGESHLDNGNALFGVSASVHPHAPKGTLRALFNGWRSLAKEHGISYIYGGSRIPGLHKFDGTAVEYLKQTILGNIFDPVLSKYSACDLKIGNLLEDYFADPESRNYGVEVYDIIVL